MFEARVFLGMQVTPAFQAALNSANPTLVSLFTQGGQEYLEVYDVDGQRFLGKTLEETIDLSRVEMIHKNIISLLNRVVPNYPIDKSDLVFIAQT
ncbi:MAG: hypothetical protein Q8K75_06815 [Chlamydiales bacterium]|nr:hypothetical protein [Chlamydiales bacterium]